MKNLRTDIASGMIILSMIILPMLTPLYAQEKTELRGVWVATLLNIDWPSSSHLSTREQKQEIISILDHHHATGINAIFLQVRPAGDAFYNSAFEPWSEWLTGSQGKEPRPYYDPLKFWIEEAHKRGMELHAWFNPFRAAVHESTHLLSPAHVVRKYPDWFVSYGGRTYFNPGIPEARQYVHKIIMDVVKRYDIDGVHFDDYFYPYKVDGQEFNDQHTYLQLGGAFNSLDDWRRNNVSVFIRNLSQALNQEKPALRFGISPFGVWRNQENDQAGSATKAGHTAFDDLYADVLLWMKNGWIDYLAPQIYWHIGFEPADYKVLLDWWSKHSYGRHIYIGQSAYKVRKDADFRAWQDPGEMPRHIRLNREYPQVKGNIYFSSKSLRINALGLGDSLKNTYHKFPALIPPMEYKPAIELESPYLYRISHGHKKLTIYWTELEKRKTEGKYQVVYRYQGQSNPGQDNPENIIAFLAPESTSFVDVPPKKGYYTYVVTSVSKSNHESPGSYALTINYRKRKPRKKKIKT
jgi:uncharacterized lipoprotein YddW (UPF0748 family)